MKILIISDLHGQIPNIYYKDFDAIILPGDICYDQELGNLIKEWMDNYKKNSFKITFSEYIKQNFKGDINQLIENSIKNGRNILEKLNEYNKPIFFIPGNWDQSIFKTKIKNADKSNFNNTLYFLEKYLTSKVNPKLIKGLNNIYNCHFKSYEFNEFNILGYGISSNTEKDYRNKVKSLSRKQKKILDNKYNQIIHKLIKEYFKVKNHKLTIFLTHNVPYNTKLDIVKDDNSPVNNLQVGSSIARDFCEKIKPNLCIGGHVHEGFGKDYIKNTLIINTGFGKNINILLEIENNQIKKIEYIKDSKKGEF